MTTFLVGLAVVLTVLWLSQAHTAQGLRRELRQMTERQSALNKMYMELYEVKVVRCRTCGETRWFI